MNIEQATYQYVAVRQTKNVIIGKIITFAVVAIIMVILASLSLPKNFVLVPAIGVILIASAVIRNFSAEYEYMVTCTRFYIDCLRGVSKRKNVLSVSLSDITESSPCNSETYDALIARASKILDFSSSPQAEGRICFFVENKSLAFIIEPNDEILQKIGLVENA